MRRVQIVMAASALMVVLLALTAGPAWAPRECPNCGQGLDTAADRGNPSERAFQATREAASNDKEGLGNPDIIPGYGLQTAQSAQAEGR